MTYGYLRVSTVEQDNNKFQGELLLYSNKNHRAVYCNNPYSNNNNLTAHLHEGNGKQGSCTLINKTTYPLYQNDGGGIIMPKKNPEPTNRLRIIELFKTTALRIGNNFNNHVWLEVLIIIKQSCS